MGLLSKTEAEAEVEVEAEAEAEADTFILHVYILQICRLYNYNFAEIRQPDGLL